jgi:hypothetical protein
MDAFFFSPILILALLALVPAMWIFVFTIVAISHFFCG